MAKHTKIPRSVFSRTSKLLLSGARIATREIGSRLATSLGGAAEGTVLATKIRQTQDLVETLGQLKGAAMKAGQLISMEFSDLLPPEVVEVLRQLHDSSSFMPFARVETILRAELGDARFNQLQDLTEEPIAAASIGQVHKATLDGHPVVVKVQFPGVAESIDSDLNALKKAMGLLLQVRGKKVPLDPLFEELAAGLKIEADYLQEAAHVEAYRGLLGASRDYVVPTVYHEMTTTRVLTLSFEHGGRLGDWLKAKPGPQAIAVFGRQVIDLLVAEFFANGLVQTDPNYGNFLYRPIERQLVLLDFGATKAYAPEFRREIRALIVAARSGDDRVLLELTHRHGLLDPRESAEVVAAYLEMMHLIAGIFAPELQPFDFSDGTFLKEIRELSMRFVNLVQFSAPAKQVIFLNRKLGGMFHLLKDAGAKIDLHAYLELVEKLTI